MAEVKKKPICVIVLGMAGSGKTSLVSRLSKSEKKPYIINLDPACLHIPYDPDIDIRDSVDYKDTMKNFKLGPNGAIVSCLNIFSTKFNDVIKFIEKCPNEICLIDTPGQIEVFTWSISGQIITQALAAHFPTLVLYVVDSVRSTSPTTFMSNMLYACSTMYKYLVPFITVMNKTDIVSHSYAIEWMTDVDSFMEVLENDESYVSTLNRRMALALDIFYTDLKICGFSALSGEGIDELYNLIDKAREEYETSYKVEYQKIKSKAEKHNELRNEEKDETSDLLITDQELNEVSNVYLRHPANDSSSDSEGEEEPYDGESTEIDAESYSKHLENQKQIQVKKAKEAEMTKSSSASTSKNNC
ncbi:GPN-loop GTPase 1 [Harmonia axyridis]|uniref:GPN-loop GTPase 1 n=1 Tax=Harmonia axyridis TaxID=115357 RepID=UPI001E278746|nr:GPN-loop GTPase 1 [Harmonia axyridis]